MSGSVVTITIGIGVGLFNTAVPIAALLQNRDVKLIVLGGHGAALANALKLPYPKISISKTAIVFAHLLAAVGTHVLATPLLQVFNMALQRHYTASARYKANGAGSQDDQLIIYLEA